MTANRRLRGPVVGEFEYRPVRSTDLGKFGLWWQLYQVRTWRYVCTPSLLWVGQPGWGGKPPTLFNGLIELSADGDGWTTVDSITHGVGRVISLAGHERIHVRIRHRRQQHIVWTRTLEVRDDDVFVVRAHDGWRWNGGDKGLNWVESGWLSTYLLGRPLLSVARTQARSLDATAWVPTKEQRAFK